MFTAFPNQQLEISPSVESQDSGWSISGQLATHTSCNAGNIDSNFSTGLVVGQTYVITYEVIAYVSGLVQISVGNTVGTARTSVGVYTETLECTGEPVISFYSDGELTINDNLSYYEATEQPNNAVTIAFHDSEIGDEKKWCSYYSFEPELMIKFINKLFSIQAGALWQHNINEVRNNFYGVQYNSEIQFYENSAPTTVKLYFSIRVQANTPWFSPNNGDINISPVVGRSAGMSSRLKKNNFKNYQGSFFADFMRNYLDTRFTNPETALFNGEPLRGRIMEINITNKDTTEAILFEVDIKTSPSMITY